jgi:hypothetical protein
MSRQFEIIRQAVRERPTEELHVILANAVTRRKSGDRYYEQVDRDAITAILEVLRTRELN